MSHLSTICMTTNKEERWIANYNALKDYISTHGQLPDKKKVDNRGLLNWWKYNMKCVRAGKIDKDKVLLLKKLSEMRTEHVVEINI